MQRLWLFLKAEDNASLCSMINYQLNLGFKHNLNCLSNNGHFSKNFFPKPEFRHPGTYPKNPESFIVQWVQYNAYVQFLLLYALPCDIHTSPLVAAKLFAAVSIGNTKQETQNTYKNNYSSSCLDTFQHYSQVLVFQAKWAI